MAKGAFQLLFGGFCPLHIWTCLKFAKKNFYAYLPWIWKLTRFTRFIWKVFVTKILLSGKFSLFQTLLQSNENVPLWSLHLLEMYQNRMMCQIDQGSISVPSRCTLHTPSTHGFLFWPNTQLLCEEMTWCKQGTESHPSCAFHQELTHHLASSWEGWGPRPSPSSSLLLSPLEAACSGGLWGTPPNVLDYQFGIPRFLIMYFSLETYSTLAWWWRWQQLDRYIL